MELTRFVEMDMSTGEVHLPPEARCAWPIRVYFSMSSDDCNVANSYRRASHGETSYATKTRLPSQWVRKLERVALSILCILVRLSHMILAVVCIAHSNVFRL